MKYYSIMFPCENIFPGLNYVPYINTLLTKKTL